MDKESIEVVVVRPSSATAQTLARITGAKVSVAGFARHSGKIIFRIEGGKDVFKRLQADGVIVKKAPKKQ